LKNVNCEQLQVEKDLNHSYFVDSALRCRPPLHCEDRRTDAEHDDQEDKQLHESKQDQAIGEVQENYDLEQRSVHPPKVRVVELDLGLVVHLQEDEFSGLGVAQLVPIQKEVDNAYDELRAVNRKRFKALACPDSKEVVSFDLLLVRHNGGGYLVVEVALGCDGSQG